MESLFLYVPDCVSGVNSIVCRFSGTLHCSLFISQKSRLTLTALVENILKQIRTFAALCPPAFPAKDLTVSSMVPYSTDATDKKSNI